MGITKVSLCIFLLAALPSVAPAADPAAELASFSVFDSVDLADLAKSDAKTAHGPPMSNGRHLSVQSCYVAAGSPAQQIEALRQWNPARHTELKIVLHDDLPASPGPGNFAKLQKAPESRALSTIVSATDKMSSDLQISRDEAKRYASQGQGGSGMPAAMVKFWSDVLSGRARALSSGGTAAQPPYDHSGEAIKPNSELNGLLSEQGKIRKQFSGFLGATGIGKGGGSLPPELYWELLEVDDQGVLTLGASYSKASGDTAQAADCLYYASGGYYVALTLYQMWAVTVDGKPSTLVWRGDMISSASLSSLHGVEKLASESAMMKDIGKAIAFFRRDTSGR